MVFKRGIILAVALIVSATAFGQSERRYLDTIVLRTGLKSAVDIDIITEYYIVFYIPNSPEEKRVPRQAVERYDRVSAKEGLDNAFNESLLYFQSDNITSYYRKGQVTVPGTTRQNLYTEARDWFDDNFTRVNWSVTMDDEEKAEITGEGLFSDIDSGLDELRFELTVKLEDGQYRYRFGSFDVYVPRALANETLFKGVRNRKGEISTSRSVREGFVACYERILRLEQSLIDRLGGEVK